MEDGRGQKASEVWIKAYNCEQVGYISQMWERGKFNKQNRAINVVEYSTISSVHMLHGSSHNQLKLVFTMQ